MRQKNVLLTAINSKYIHSNLAVYSLRANAREYADQIELAEYTINQNTGEILEGIYRRKPDVVGFSCYIWNIEYVLEIANNLKKVLPDTTIIFGGPEVSYNAAEILSKYSFVDLVMVGEGENTFYEYLSWYFGDADIELKEVDGLCIREGATSFYTPARKAAKMDDLMFPYADLSDMENRILYYETIRGCPFSCSYCLSSVEKTVRLRSLPLVFKELDFFIQNRVKQVKFVDRTFNCNHEHAYKIWEYLAVHDNGVTNFHFEIGGDLLREEDFQLFKQFRPGLVQFEIGVQSTNPDTIKAIRRTMNLDELNESIAKVRANRNIHQHLDLIAGLPYEDYDSFHRSFNDVYAMRPDQFQLGFLKVLKGSYMNEVKDEYGMVFGVKPPYEVLASKWLPYDDVLRLKQVEDMVEIHYNSFQFTMTMALFEKYSRDAFSIYENLGQYYDRHGYFGVQHNRVARYEIVWDYVCENFPEHKEEFRETLTYDLFLRDYVKNAPEFVRERDKEYLNSVRDHLSEMVEKKTLPNGYEHVLPKQLFHIIYMNQFTLDMDALYNKGEVKHVDPYSLMFDYRNRDPLSHSACVTHITNA